MATTVVDVVMPQMGVSVSEGTILKWLKQVGETIAADEPLLEISTDKVDTEVPSPGSGVIREILVQEGETVDVGTRLAVIAPEGAEVAAETAPEPEPAPTAEVRRTSGPAPAAATPAPSPAAAGNGGGERTFVSPVVARIAAEHGVDVGQVAGTGAGGRVTKKDILAFVESGGAAPAAAAPAEAPVETPAEPAPEAAAPPAPAAAPPPPPPAPVAAAASAPPAAAAAPPPAVGGWTVEPMNAMRRGSSSTSPSLDTPATLTARSWRHDDGGRDPREAEEGVRGELRRHRRTFVVARPLLDILRETRGSTARSAVMDRHANYVNSATPSSPRTARGCRAVRPERRGPQPARHRTGGRDLAERSRTRSRRPTTSRRTFTMTNPGGYAMFHGTPVISQPQAAILGTYAVVKRPWVIQDDSRRWT